MHRTLTLTLCISAVACATTTPGTRPHDMSAAAHEQRAADEERIADTHGEQYQPEAVRERSRCSPRRGDLTDVCWTSIDNPTERHVREAEEHRRIAAEHRAASSALATAEAQACVGVAPDDRDISPFTHADDIASVDPLIERTTGRNPTQRTSGAIVTFRAVPGMTTQWLQRVVDCHLARNSALGHVAPEMADCPLVPRGAEAQVQSTRTGFAVSIRAEDDATSREILERSHRLLQH